MKGMGKYTLVEEELSHLSADEKTELYLSGRLDDMYEDFDRTGEVNIKRNNHRKKKSKGE
jgi:hypothetical protein